MNTFEGIADEIIQSTDEIESLRLAKHDFAKLINYQINQLFERLSKIKTEQDAKAISMTKENVVEPKEPTKISDELKILTAHPTFCYDFTAESYIYFNHSFCEYLFVSQQNLRRTYTISQITDEYIFSFFSLLQSEEKIVKKLATSLLKVETETLFNEIDFFGNGYIDSAAMFEFLKHYNKNNKKVEEEKIKMLIKLIHEWITIREARNEEDNIVKNQKNSITIDDIIKFQSIGFTAKEMTPKAKRDHIESSQSNQNEKILSLSKIEQNNYPITLEKSSEQRRNTSLETFNLVENSNLFPEINPNIKNQLNLTIEEKLIRNHKRNEIYLNEIKRSVQTQLSFTVPLRPNLSSSPFVEANEVEILFKLQMIGDMMETKKNKVVEMIERHTKFTFLNSYNAIDQLEKNSVNCDEFFDFLSESGIEIAHKKSKLFFDQYSSEGIMQYSDYLKIYKIPQIKDYYEKCQQRFPLLCEKWPKKTQEEFCAFFKSIILLTHDILRLYNDLNKYKKESILAIFKNATYIEQLHIILGEKYPCLADLLCQSGQFKISLLEEQLSKGGSSFN